MKNTSYNPLESAPYLGAEALPPVPPVAATAPGHAPVPPQLVPPVPPVPPVAPAAPAYVGAASSMVEETPDWETPSPRPAFVDQVPDAVVDAREPAHLMGYARAGFEGSTPDGNHAAYVVPSAPPVAPAPVPSIATPRLARLAPVAPAAPVIPEHNAPRYSPMRDDPNAYHVSFDLNGVRYYVRELDDKTRAFIMGASPRFAENPAHRIVEATGVLQPRPIALEEVIGGTVEKYGEDVTYEPGYIYTQYPELKDALTVRHLTNVEVDNALQLAAEHPTTYAKYLKVQVKDYERVLAGNGVDPGCLVGWSLPFDVSPESVRGLALSVKRWLYNRIAASSEFGVNEDDFSRGR